MGGMREGDNELKVWWKVKKLNCNVMSLLFTYLGMPIESNPKSIILG